MTDYEILQNYWWLLISVLGAILVFMLFVQGGQTMLLNQRDQHSRDLMVGALGKKWELTFTTLVVFGGAFFASFPLFYSTSFGGAYWLWMLILFSFIVQAVSYEYRGKPGNLLGRRTYDVFLFINGCFGCILLGVAVGTMFFGGEFEVIKGNLLDTASPVISRWASTHGLEAIANWRCLLLGVMVLMLARTLAGLYFINYAHGQHPDFEAACRRRLMFDSAIFVVLFLAFAAVLLTSSGMTVTIDDAGKEVFELTPYKYLHNYLQMWWAAAALLIGVVLVLWGIGVGCFTRANRSGIWFAGVGTILVVLSLFWVAGYNGTAYLPSLTDPASSLTIANSSSSQFTLKVMACVSVLVPFVVAYIAYVWRKMDAPTHD